MVAVQGLRRRGCRAQRHLSLCLDSCRGSRKASRRFDPCSRGRSRGRGRGPSRIRRRYRRAGGQTVQQQHRRRDRNCSLSHRFRLAPFGLQERHENNTLQLGPRTREAFRPRWKFLCVLRRRTDKDESRWRQVTLGDRRKGKIGSGNENRSWGKTGDGAGPS